MLRTGVKIPSLGFGTWFLDDDKAKDAVKETLTVGYHHIDTAEVYGNEVGEGIRPSGKRREEVFITTKLLSEAKTYDSTKEAIESSLNKLNVGVIDLMIIHSPEPWNDFRGGDYMEGNREAWRALEDYYLSGKLRAIGVSNFQKKIWKISLLPAVSLRWSIRFLPISEEYPRNSSISVKRTRLWSKPILRLPTERCSREKKWQK